MSTSYMTIDEAARHLSVSRRQVQTYLRDHLLSSTKKSGSRKKWLDAGEVEELRVDRLETRSIPNMRGEVLRLRGEVRKNTAQLAVVLRMLNVEESPLNLGAEHATQLHQAAVAQLSQTNWEMGELASWAEVFLRCSEEDLRFIRDCAADPKPWRPLLRLCMAMTTFTVAHSSYATNLELQLLHRKFAEGRRRIRISAMCFEDLYGVGVDRELHRALLVDTPGSVRDRILHRAAQKPR